MVKMRDFINHILFVPNISNIIKYININYVIDLHDDIEQVDNILDYNISIAYIIKTIINTHYHMHKYNLLCNISMDSIYVRRDTLIVIANISSSTCKDDIYADVSNMMEFIGEYVLRGCDMTFICDRFTDPDDSIYLAKYGKMMRKYLSNDHSLISMDDFEDMVNKRHICEYKGAIRKYLRTLCANICEKYASTIPMCNYLIDQYLMHIMYGDFSLCAHIETVASCICYISHIVTYQQDIALSRYVYLVGMQHTFSLDSQHTSSAFIFELLTIGLCTFDNE